jgi:hypothetical protein
MLSEPDDPRRFFLIWSPQGGPPVVRFPSFNAARAIAIRLSLKHPEQDFFVLASCFDLIGKPAPEVGPPGPEAPAPDPEAVP